MNGLLDKVPAWVQHGILLFAGAFGLSAVAAVQSAGGITHLGWAWVAPAVDSAALAVVGVGALALTKLTTQYGKGSS